MPTAPLIVNLLPQPGQADFDLTAPVRFTVRDPETHINAGLLHVSVGYAQVHADGGTLFDEDTALPGTFYATVLTGFLNSDEANFLLVGEGVQITKTVAGLQRSVVFTPIEADVGFPDIMITAVMRPDIVTISEPGAVLGMEHGPRNIGVYLFFENTGGGAQIRVTGPADKAGVRVPDRVVVHDWTVIQRYIIVWNEEVSVMELYSVSAAGVTTLVTTEPVANFQEFDVPTASATVRQGGAAAITAVYGIEGALGDRVTIGNVSVTRDVAYPIIGIRRPGQFETTRRTDESIRYEGGDPRTLEISPWFGPPTNSLFPNPDPAGAVVPLAKGIRISKITPSTTFAVHREEPGVQTSSINGYMLETEFFATPTAILGTRITGMGFLIHDGQTSLFLALLEGPNRTIGILNNGGDITTIGDYIRPSTDIDWSSPVRFRVSVDPRRNKLELFLSSNVVTPIMSIAFDRGALAVPADLGLVAKPPLIAFGHLNELATAGSFELRDLVYSHTYQAWESRDGVFPDILPTNPVWQSITTGFLEISPLSGLSLLGGGFGPTPLGYFVLSGTGPPAAASFVGSQLQIAAEPSESLTYYRAAPFDDQRGAIIETSLQITSNKPRARSGCFLVLDDGLVAYMLSFVDTDVGKFAGVTVRAGLGSFIEQVGDDGPAENLSFRIDWDQPHIYRMERRPSDGLYIFVDNDSEPALVILDSTNVDYPSSQFNSPTIAFGVLSSEGSTSLWDYTRGMFGSGYEISFKLKTDTAGLEEKIRNSQAVIVASADDV